MNLQHLRYLAAFAEHRTLTGAADFLGISQPAMSRALHELQDELRCDLFQRSGRRLELTPAGQAVLAAARRALAAVADIQRVPDEHAALSVLRIGTHGAMAAGMSPILEEFLRKQPDTQVQVLHVDRDAELLDMLHRRDVDLCYGAITRAPRELRLMPARPLEILLASPIGTDLPPTITLRSLDQLPMLCPPPTEERRRLLDEPCSKAGVTLRIVLESADPTTFMSGIQAGIGSTVVWDVNAAQAQGIEVRSFDPPRRVPVGFLHHAKPSDAVRLLLGIARQMESKRQMR